MSRLENAMRIRMQGDASTSTNCRWGIVNGAKDATVKVLIQPEGVQTDWLPLLSSAVGGGWGLVHVPPNGTPVFLIPDAGDHESFVVAGSTWSATNAPPAAAQGEVWLVHSSGSFVKLTNDGKLSIQDAGGCSLVFSNNGTATLTGTLAVTGDIIDVNGGHGSLNTLRSDYNAHKHTGVLTGGSTTGTTDHATP